MLRIVEKLNLSLAIPPILGLVVGHLILQGLSKYVFILCISVGFVFLSLVRPLQALFIYIILFPLLSTFSISLGGGIPDLSFNRVGVIIILAAVLFRAYFGKTNLKSGGYVELWMLIFSLLATVSMIMNYNTEQFISNMLFLMDSLIIPFILYFLAKNLFSEKEHFTQLTKVLLIPAIYLAIMGIYEAITLTDLLPATYLAEAPEQLIGLTIAGGIARANGPFQYSMAFGAVLAMILLVLSYHLGPKPRNLRTNLLGKWIRLFVLPLIAVGLYCNMFRAIWLGTFAGLSIRFGIFREQRLKTMGVILLIGIVAWGGFGIIKSTEIYTKRVSNLETVYTRIATYKSALVMFFDNPIIGSGFHSFSSGEIYEFRGSFSAESAHNAYLRVLVENGFLGFFAFMMIIFSFLRHILRAYKIEETLEGKKIAATCLGVFVILLVASFFDNVALWGNVNNLFYLLMGVLASRQSRVGGETEVLFSPSSIVREIH